MPKYNFLGRRGLDGGEKQTRVVLLLSSCCSSSSLSLGAYLGGPELRLGVMLVSCGADAGELFCAALRITWAAFLLPRPFASLSRQKEALGVSQSQTLLAHWNNCLRDMRPSRAFATSRATEHVCSSTLDKPLFSTSKEPRWQFSTLFRRRSSSWSKDCRLSSMMPIVWEAWEDGARKMC